MFVRLCSYKEMMPTLFISLHSCYQPRNTIMMLWISLIWPWVNIQKILCEWMSCFLSMLSLMFIFPRFSSHSFQEGMDLKNFFSLSSLLSHSFIASLLIKGLLNSDKGFVLEGRLEVDSWSYFVSFYTMHVDKFSSCMLCSMFVSSIFMQYCKKDK